MPFQREKKLLTTTATATVIATAMEMATTMAEVAAAA